MIVRGEIRLAGQYSKLVNSLLIEGAVSRLGVAAKDADRVVAEMNRNRELYVRRHFNREWRDVTNYQICIDTGWLGLDGAAELIVGLVRKQFAVS